MPMAINKQLVLLLHLRDIWLCLFVTVCLSNGFDFWTHFVIFLWIQPFSYAKKALVNKKTKYPMVFHFQFAVAFTSVLVSLLSSFSADTKAVITALFQSVFFSPFQCICIVLTWLWSFHVLNFQKPLESTEFFGSIEFDFVAFNWYSEWMNSLPKCLFWDSWKWFKARQRQTLLRGHFANLFVHQLLPMINTWVKVSKAKKSAGNALQSARH